MGEDGGHLEILKYLWILLISLNFKKVYVINQETNIFITFMPEYCYFIISQGFSIGIETIIAYIS